MKKKRKLGRVVFELGYVVDLNDSDMIDHARDCLLDDLMYIYKEYETASHIRIVPDDDGELRVSDIPDFLKEKDI